MSDLPVNDKHLAELRASGLTDETIRAAGIETIDDTEAGKRLGWTSKVMRHGSGIWFARADADGKVNGLGQFKPDYPRTNKDGKTVKYETPKSTPNFATFGPNFKRQLNSGKPIIVTEGVKKMLAVDQLGYPAIGLSGVWAFGHKRKRNETGKPYGKRLFIPELAAIGWPGRRVGIAYDSDATTKHQVQHAEAELGRLLAEAGAHPVVVRLPDVGEGKTGLDDFLVHHGDAGPVELEKLLQIAEPAQLRQPPTAYDDAKAFLSEAASIKGKPAIVFTGDLFYWFDKSHYIPMQATELTPRAHRWLAEHGRNDAPSHARNVVDCLKALTVRSFDQSPPYWLHNAPDAWPDCTEIIAGRNGLLRLSSLEEGGKPEIRPHAPDYFNLNALDFDIDFQAPKPVTFLNFLSDLWPDDPESIDTLLEVFGYLLTSDTSQQKMFLLMGPKRAGKGVLLRVLHALVGMRNTASPTFASLATNFGLSPLLNKTVATISDARLSGKPDQGVIVERLLSISGEDYLTIDRKHQSQVTQKLSARIVIASNELPRLVETSGALASRFILLRMTNSFYGREDMSLTAKLLGELPGIFLLALAGLQRLRERGHFIQPASGQALIEELHEIASPVATFVSERCELRPHAEVTVSKLYEAWQAWCEENGKRWTSDVQTFGRDLLAAHPQITKHRPRTESGGRVRIYRGIELG